jgi:hypothetical protein
MLSKEELAYEDELDRHYQKVSDYAWGDLRPTDLAGLEDVRRSFLDMSETLKCRYHDWHHKYFALLLSEIKAFRPLSVWERLNLDEGYDEAHANAYRLGGENDVTPVRCFYAWVRDGGYGDWKLLWTNKEPTGPHWLELCKYREEDKHVEWIRSTTWGDYEREQAARNPGSGLVEGDPGVLCDRRTHERLGCIPHKEPARDGAAV